MYTIRSVKISAGLPMPLPLPSRPSRRRRVRTVPQRNPSDGAPVSWDVASPPSFEVESFYRVLLHYSQWNNGEHVARLVRFAVPIISMNESIRIVSMAESYETSIVVTVKKDEAELYAQRLLIAGLKSSTEEA